MKKQAGKLLSFFLAVVLTSVICLTNVPFASASASTSAYLELANDIYIPTPTTILSKTIYFSQTQQVYIQSDGRIYHNSTEDCARMRIYVDGQPVGSDSIVDWRESVRDAQHSYNCIAAVTLPPGNHTFSLMAIPLAGSFIVGAKSNLSIMTNVTVNMQSVSMSADSPELSFTTYGMLPGTPVPNTQLLSINVNNTSGPIIAMASSRGYYTSSGGDMMIGIYKDGVALPTDQGTWSVNDSYSGCERQAPMFNHAFINDTGSHTISMNASEIPWPASIGENPVKYKVGSGSTLIVINGEMAVCGSASQTVSAHDTWNWKIIGTGTGEAVPIARAIVNIPEGHNGEVLFQAKTRFQGDISDLGGHGFLWINIDGTDVGSVGIQQIVSGSGDSQRTACASYFSAGPNALSPGNHVVTVYAKAEGNFAHLCTSTDLPLIWFDGKSGTPATGQNLLVNPDFESGILPWGSSLCSISITNDANSGNNALLVSSRTGLNSVAYQDITSILTINGMGGYRLSAFGKLATGVDNAYIEIFLTESTGGRSYIIPSTTLNSTSYKKMMGTVYLTWSGTLVNASLYVKTMTSYPILYLDDFHVSKY